MVAAMDKSTESLAEFGNTLCVTFFFPLFFALAALTLPQKGRLIRVWGLDWDLSLGC